MVTTSSALSLTLPTSLSQREAQAIIAFRDWLMQTMPDQVERLILFGSKARGDTHSESDVDIFLVLREATREQRNRVLDFTVDLTMEHEVNLTAIVYGHEELQQQVEIGMPLVRNVAMEGIPLIGEGIKVGKGKPEEVARIFLQEAHERLTSTRVLVEAGQYHDAVSRAYYAVLDAADGVLAILGLTPKSYEGIMMLLSFHLIKSGRVEARYSGLLNKIQKARREADYNRMIDFTESDARTTLSEAEDFVAMLEALIPTLLAEQASESAESVSEEKDSADGVNET
jgi:uncharacterized protein (UPF0332 family)/predicted nucleotidyltransferase